ncbi:MAG: class I SAM-dependent methyltransferase [Deltaproteobacteria bacterium]
MILADNWKDYEIIDTGDGEKLERWGKYILRRPDPQVIWPSQKAEMWKKVDAHYNRSKSGGGSWSFFGKLPEKWPIAYRDLRFYVQPTGFKHTGLFPEQAVNWDWMIEKIKGAKRPIRVLNLFAYSGGATTACAYAGAEVCHIDASKGMVARAKENLTLSGLSDKKVRLIVEDVFKFVEREKRRGSKYEAIIMDPPSYGRGAKGEVWNIEDSLYSLIQNCMQILSDKPLFFLVNSYTTGLSANVISNIITLTLGKKFKGKIYGDELGIPITGSNIILPCGNFARWEE